MLRRRTLTSLFGGSSNASFVGITWKVTNTDRRGEATLFERVGVDYVST